MASVLKSVGSFTVLFLGLNSTFLASAVENRNTSTPSQVKQPVNDAYILGPGDTVEVELLNIPELSGRYTIGPDGTIYLPRLRGLFVDGLTIEELRYFLTEQFKTYVKDPQLYLRPVSYRAVQVYVGGEIGRPGYYLLSNGNSLDDSDDPGTTFSSNSAEKLSALRSSSLARTNTTRQINNNTSSIKGVSTRWPTLFDALRAAEGVTPFSNLSKVQVTRKQPLSSGGGKMRANVNFLRLVTSGDESVNIRLFDGDVINVGRSPLVVRDQLLAASRTNLSPDFIEVYVSGRVKDPGQQTLPQGATLNQAIASAGGTKLLRGNVEFLRFNPDGTSDRRRFSYNPSAGTDDFKNPVLMQGDVVRVNDSLLSSGVEVLNEITGPAVGIYSVYSLFKP